MTRKLDNSVKIKGAITGIVTIVFHFGTVSPVSGSSDADYSFVTSSDWHNCQQINSDYQEVYAFETASFYINICQKDELYFYSGEAKQSEQPGSIFSLRNSIFIPAIPLTNHRGFHAENGNVTYLVLLPFAEQNKLQSTTNEPTEAILTIKRNGQLVSVESSLNKYCYESNAIAFDNIDNINFNSLTYNQLATIPQQQDIGWDLSSASILPTEIFNSDTHFDFYRIDGKLHRLTTCN